jgi:hypothetical protein
VKTFIIPDRRVREEEEGREEEVGGRGCGGSESESEE